MSTCPNCGSEYADGTSCVVCGYEPDAADASVDTPEGEPTTSEPGPPADDVAAVDDVDAVDEPPATGEANTTWPSADTGETRDPANAGESAAAEDLSTGPGGDPAGVGAATAAPTATTAGQGGTSHAGQDGGLPPPSIPPPPSRPAVAGAPATPPTGALPVTESDRNWAMVAHLSALVAAGFGGLGFLGPLVVWLAKKDDSRFVQHHAVEALNFNLSLMLYGLLAILVGLTIVGLVVAVPAVVVAIVLWFVTSIVAAVKAQRGEAYRYPITIRLIRE